MTDLQGAWLTTVFLVVVASVLDIDVHQFALHSALARAKVHAPDIAGLVLFALWAPTIAVWLIAGIAIGLLRHAACSSGDLSALWLGLLYPLTIWPPAFLARKVKVSMPGWYWAAQALPALTLVVMGGLPCLL